MAGKLLCWRIYDHVCDGDGEMIYYFVKWDGDLSSEDNAKGWYETMNGGDIFTDRRKAIVEARKRTKARIAELKEYLEEVKCYRHTE